MGWWNCGVALVACARGGATSLMLPSHLLDLLSRLPPAFLPPHSARICLGRAPSGGAGAAGR